MSYRIVTDTCCDMSARMYEELNLPTVSLSVNFRGESISKYNDEWLKGLYDGMRAGESVSTAAANPEDWSAVMDPILAGGEDVLVLAFSSGLSTTYQSAVIAAQDLKEKYPERTIRVVDTLCASMGQGLLVYYACRKRDAGASLEEVAAWCEDNKMNVSHWFTVDDLVYLKRGGRVSAATALVGTMLKIKPILHVDEEGKLVNVAKTRGRKASLDALAAKAGELMLPEAKELMFISQADCLEDAEYVASVLKEKYGVKKVVISYISAVIGSHAGPGTVALFFMGKQR